MTSAAPGEGKTTLVANLAVVLGETGKRVLVLSCDFRRPTIHELLEVPNLHGPRRRSQGSDVAPGPERLRPGYPVRRRERGTERRVVRSPRRDPRAPTRCHARSGRPAARADVVLVDTAPILAASDAAHLIPGADEVVVVARAGVVTTSLAQQDPGGARAAAVSAYRRGLERRPGDRAATGLPRVLPADPGPSRGRRGDGGKPPPTMSLRKRIRSNMSEVPRPSDGRHHGPPPLHGLVAARERRPSSRSVRPDGTPRSRTASRRDCWRPSMSARSCAGGCSR